MSMIIETNKINLRKFKSFKKIILIKTKKIREFSKKCFNNFIILLLKTVICFCSKLLIIADQIC